MAKCDSEITRLVNAIGNYIGSIVQYEYVQKLKPTEMKSGESERSWEQVQFSKNQLHDAFKEFKKCEM